MSRIVFVTGASRGLGHHIAASLHGTQFEAVSLTRAEGFDVNDYESMRTALRPYATREDLWGLVHCAGIGFMGLTLSMHETRLDKIIATNLLGTIYVNKLVGQLLARRRRGRIINFSSIAATMAIRGEAAYSASKAGVETFSRAFAREMSVFGVTVNCVAPGPIDTDMTENIAAGILDSVIAQQAIQRKATVEEVARITRWLLAEESGMVTGDVFHVGGA